MGFIIDRVQGTGKLINKLETEYKRDERLMRLTVKHGQTRCRLQWKETQKRWLKKEEEKAFKPWTRWHHNLTK